MSQNAKDTAATPDADEVRADITALTRDLAALIDKIKIVAADSSSEAIRDSVEALGGQAGKLYEKVTVTGNSAARTVGKQIEAKPVLSLLIAFSIGFCASRFFSR